VAKVSKKQASLDIENARLALEKEIEGLNQLKAWLDDPFVQAVELLHNTRGHVVLSGMGKSGHIANKIAATFSSTGTPALFVHPGEASHGDLGVITKDDVLVLFSNSGETIELKDIINYAKRFSIPLIGVVRRKTSVLADAANVALVLPDAPEACLVNAPTTSTTMMLALGDALAVALLERRGFTTDDFSVFHPGGKLGTAFIKVKDLMHKGSEVPVAFEDTLMTKVLIEMTAKRFGCIAILNKKNEFSGIITDGDLRRHMSNTITTQTAKEIMTVNPVTIAEHQLASEALALMQRKAITNLFIVKNNKPVGILHIHDLLRAGVL
jgi:arabinose-5-phosphate isomerase